MRYLFILLLAALVVPVMSAENPTVERFGDGWVNWERQVVKAVGHGIPPSNTENEAQATLMARSAAMADAYRNLASIINGVRVTGDTYVKNFVTESDEIRLKVEGFIKGAEIISDKELPDHSYEIILQVPLVGKNSLISVIPFNASESTYVGDGKPTGVIINASGLGVKPAMNPRIYAEDGTEVYGTVAVSPDYAIEIGVAGYPRSLEQALRSSRTGSHPLIVKAVRKSEKHATDLVVSNSDAARIREVDQQTGILSQCRVAILITER